MGRGGGTSQIEKPAETMSYREVEDVISDAISLGFLSFEVTTEYRMH